MNPPTDRGHEVTLRPLGVDLASFGARTAVVTGRGELSYRDLAYRVAQATRRLGPRRRLVLVTGANDVEALVAYLGALAGGHVVLLAPGADSAALASLVAAYDPDVVIGSDGDHRHYDERRPGTAHELHPDLAVLLSTSGSTGSPKLVRLSHDNLRSNAESIARYLGIRESDRAATTLPMQYCYGLSVINSHLMRGAGLVLTDLSVADACFWDLFRRARATSFAGVPYTFALLDRVGFAEMDLPDLRYVTQAGGRLAPELVRRWAETGRRRGWDLYVMYGQTEATARMAYLPPEHVTTRPGAIGVAVPGGRLRLEPVAEAGDPDVGELVYTGPNVMLGYANSPADLALGRTVHELRTGDLARRGPDGLFEIVGRRSRFVKVFGLRIDLERIEAGLAADGVTAACLGGDDELVVAVVAAGYRDRLDRLVAARAGLPRRAVRIVVVDELPRLASGKVDQAAVARLAAEPAAPDAPVTSAEAGVLALYAEVLDRDDVTEDRSFVDLGGDSLSYVELSVRLEHLLGKLPSSWHTRPIRELQAVEARPRGRWRAIETSVWLRAVAIVLIAGSHIGVFTVRGGAHLLLAVAGFNFARFQLTGAARSERVRHVARSVARIAVPSCIYLAFVVLVLGEYGWKNIFLLNEAIGPRYGREVYFWFIETLVYVLLALALVIAVPAVDRCERRWPFLVPVVLLGAALTVRYGVVEVSPYDPFSTPVSLFWLFALGWAAGKARTWPQKLLVAGVGAVSCVGYFDTFLRQSVVIVGLLLLVLVPRLPGTALANRLAAVLAGSSLYIYLTHWEVYPVLENHNRPLALLVSLAVGVLFGAAVDRVRGALTRLRPAVAALPRPRRRAPRTVEGPHLVH